MKRILALAFAFLAFSCASLAAAPDAPGTKLVTIQAGGFPGVGAVVTGSIGMANLGSSHLYGGLQFGVDSRKGSTAGRMDLSLAPRFTLGLNLAKALEVHVGGLAGICAQQLSFAGSTDDTKLGFCYGGFGGFRFRLSDTLGLVAEGCYSPQLPYATLGLSFRF